MSSALREYWSDRSFPERPDNVSDRQWDMFVQHVRDGRTFAAIAKDHDVTSVTVRESARTVDRKIRWPDDLSPWGRLNNDVKRWFIKCGVQSGGVFSDGSTISNRGRKSLLEMGFLPHDIVNIRRHFPYEPIVCECCGQTVDKVPTR